MNARADRFPLFDGLRAIAALSVLVYHVSGGGFNRLPSPLREALAHGDVGVAIFFVISGFLLYRPFVRARLRGDPMPRVAAYAWRRFLRIAPAYWVALTVVALVLGLHGVFTATGIPRFYGFAQIYWQHTAIGGIGQAWTLCVEVAFYVFLPLWALAQRRGGGRVDRELAALALLAAAGTAYIVWAAGAITPTGPGPYLEQPPGFVDQFALGMLLATLSARWEANGGRPPAAAWRFPSAGWALAALAFATVTLQPHLLGAQSRAGAYLVHHELYSLVAVGVVAPAVLFPAGRGLPGRVLGNRVLLTLGLWSYGIYLYHVAVIAKLQRPVDELVPAGAGWHFAGLAAATLVVTAAAAAVSYRLVERPALSLKNRVAVRSPAARGEAIAEPAPGS